MAIIILDFDGTCVAHEFPKIGKEIGAVPVLKELVSYGHKLILFTMRGDRYDTPPTNDPTIANIKGLFLTEAVDWFNLHDIPLYGIQKNPTQHNWTDSPKAYGDLMIDDSALGTPLVDWEKGRPYVDWKTVRVMLKKRGYFTRV